MCAAAVACDAETGLLVVVDSDIPDIGSFEVAVWSGEVRSDATLRSRRIFVLGDEVSFPASLGIVPREGDALRRVRIEVVGFTPRGTVNRVVTTGFVEGETREVRIVLLERCTAVRCEQGLTCGEDGCESEARPAALLPSVGERPRPARDASAMDLGPRDGGRIGSRDAADEPDTATSSGDLGPPPPDLGPPTGPCTEGFELRGGSCYLKIEERRDWQSAEAECVSRGGHLASVDSDDEADAVASIGGSAPWWIGLGPSPVTRGMRTPLGDVDRVAGLCASSVPSELAGEGVVAIDPSGATDDLAPEGTAVCFPKIPVRMLPDVGFTVTLPRRSVLVMRGDATGKGGAVTFAIDGGCRTPYPTTECAIVAPGAPIGLLVRGPGTVGIVNEVFFGAFDLYVAALGWTSGEAVTTVPSNVDTDPLALDEVPCVAMQRDGDWMLDGCQQPLAFVCEAVPAG